MKELAILLENVNCSYGGQRGLSGLSIKAERGQVLGLVGPNGAGKTTLISVVCGLLTPDSGTVTVFGKDVRKCAREIARQIGVVPQETALYEEVTPTQNLRFSADLYGLSDARKRIADALELVGLSERSHQPTRELSGGMKRRLAIARALLHDPGLLILDEPTLGVDAQARHQIWAHLRRLRSAGRTVLLATNYLDEAEALCDRVAMMQGGSLVAEDSVASLLARVGRCLELGCREADLAKLEARMGTLAGVLRAERIPDALVVYFSGTASVDELVKHAMGAVTLEGFRVRSPDLVEVFGALSRGKAS